MEEKKLVPKLRFPGFTEPWEQRKLGEITTYRNGAGHEEKQSAVGKYEVVNLNSISIDGGLKPSGKFIDEETETLIKDDLVMVLSDVGHGDLLGRVAIIPENNRFVLNQRVALLRNNGIADIKYLFSYINAHQRYFKLQGAGSSQLNISKESVETFEVLLPSKDEQKKIGECFTNLDHLITLHHRKLEHLKLKKKSLLQKLFPKEGEVYPELRFPGFTDPWEQRKLSEVTTCFDNLRVPVTASDRVPGKIPYYGANGIQDYVSGHTHSGEFVLIAEDGANDLNDYPIQYVNGAIWVNNHAHVIAGYKEKLENKFLSYSLKTVKMSTFIVGGGRSKLNLKALLEIPISMPNHDEQCCIGKFIENIDKNITLHQRKLEHLQLLKKALLQQLFV